MRYIEWASATRYTLTFVIKRQLNSLTAATISEEKRSHLVCGRSLKSHIVLQIEKHFNSKEASVSN